MFNKFKRKRPTFSTSPTIPRKRFFRRPEISRTKVTIILLVIFLLLIVYALFFSKLFKLRLVEFEPKTISCVEKNLIAAVLPKDQNILTINVERAANTIQTKFPCLEYVSMRKKFPETVVIMARERKMVALIRSGIKVPEIKVEVSDASPSSQSAMPRIPPRDDFKVNEGDFNKSFAVDKDGYVLAENPVTEEQLPLFYYLSDQELEINHMLESDTVPHALALSTKLWEMGIEIKTQKIIDTSLYIDGPQRIIFLLEKDVSEQVIPLQLILQKAKMDSTPIAKVDLRFDKPVVVYNKKVK